MTEKVHDATKHEPVSEPLAEEKKDAKEYMGMKDKSDRFDFAFLAASMILFAGGIELVRQTQAMTGPSQTLYAVGTIMVTAFAAYFGHIYIKLMKD